ncbi:MAG: LacI family DNA-binding transcriptional regulator [Brevinematales bacterium]|jgi:LacI family transcriptional regulator
MTIKEIAKLANVSIGTVDRVMHGRGRVSKETSETIKKLISESDFKPDIFGRRLSLSKEYSFGVLMPRLYQDSKYWEMSARGIEHAQKELKAFKVKIKYYFYDRYSESSIKKEMDKINSAGTDGLLIAPVLHRPVKVFLESIADRIPYVLFNANIPDSNALSYIGQDSFQSGVLSAKLMKMMVREKCSIAVIIPAPDDYHIVERADGFYSFFEEYPDYRIRSYSLSPCTRDIFYAMMKEIISDEDVKGIFVANAATHYAAEYLKDHRGLKKINLVGYDPTEENIKYLKDGYIDYLISQKAEMQGYRGIYALYRSVVLQEPLEKHIMMPLDIITNENLIYYQKY